MPLRASPEHSDFVTGMLHHRSAPSRFSRSLMATHRSCWNRIRAAPEKSIFIHLPCAQECRVLACLAMRRAAKSNASDSKILAASNLDCPPAACASLALGHFRQSPFHRNKSQSCLHQCVSGRMHSSQPSASLSVQRSMAQLMLALPLGDTGPTSSTCAVGIGGATECATETLNISEALES